MDLRNGSQLSISLKSVTGNMLTHKFRLRVSTSVTDTPDNLNLIPILEPLGAVESFLK